MYLYQPCLSFFSTRVYFKGHISLSQRPINSPYFTHLWAHFSRLLPLAVLTSITSHCHSSLILMSSWQSWKLLGLRRTTKSFYMSLKNWEGGHVCLFICFCRGLCYTSSSCTAFVPTLSSLKFRNIWALEICCYQIWMSCSLGLYTAKHIACLVAYIV